MMRRRAGQLSYQEIGPADGPVLLLLHGLVSDSTTWQPSLEPLAGHGLRVIALDLLGHGQSDAPRIGYSLEDFADSIHQFLLDVGIATATLAGHSLGGAIAMTFAHDYPDQAARLILVASGGLGRQVHLVLRSVTVPGASSLLRVAVNQHTAHLYRQPRLHRALGLQPEAIANLSRIGRSMLTDQGRATFVSAARSVIGPGGQLGSMIELDYLDPGRPTMIVWCEGDPIIPASHAHATHRHLPRSRLEIFPGRSHEPHRRYAQRFADAAADFIAQTPPFGLPR